MNTSSLKGGVKPNIIELVNGVFKKDGSQIVAADGASHKVSGDGYVDEISITVQDAHVVEEIDKVNGKVAYTVEYVISPDGKTLTWHVVSYTSPSGEAVASETVQRRLGPAIKGAHLLSEKWQRVSVTVDSKSDWLLKLDGKLFNWRTAPGTGYDGLVGGSSVKIDGDSSGAHALITRPRPDTIVETDLTTSGERAAILSMQIIRNGKTIRGKAFSPRARRTTTFYLDRAQD